MFEYICLYTLHFILIFMKTSSLNLADYHISAETGFLPDHFLPGDYAPENKQKQDPSNGNVLFSDYAHNRAWHQLAANLPKFLPTGRFKQMVADLPPYEYEANQQQIGLEWEMRTLSYLGHAYLWNENQVSNRLPANLSKAWVTVAKAVGMPPILSYPSYCLFNFTRLDPTQPAYLGNILINQNFLGGLDEDWFILIHVDIEARAAQALRAIPDLLQSTENNDVDGMKTGLQEVYESLQKINATMNRMPENCDPYIYYTRVRPYIFGTKNNPALPKGLIYEGCFNNQPQFFRGETGAQSSIVPTMDGLLGVSHENDPLKEYLMEMRDYMVPAHRRFIEAVEQQSTLRQRVVANLQEKELLDLYNGCVEELFRFRAKHLEYAATYIHKQATQSNNSTAFGTGGTPFMEYLAKHRDETKLALHTV